MGNVFVLQFFGFLRVSKFTIPSGASYNSTCHLSMKDVAINSRDNPRLLQVVIKQYKTDLFRKGIDIYLHCRCNRLYNLPSQSNFSIFGFERWPSWAPLHYTRGKNALPAKFSSALESLLSKLKLNHKHYNTHSFQIGAATSAPEARIPDSQIKMLGRWQSDAYQCYVKTPPI